MIDRPDSLLKPQRLAGALIKLLFAAVYCFGLSRLILDLLGLPARHGLQAAAILLVLTVLAALTWQRYNLLAFGGLWLILLMLAVLIREKLIEPALDLADDVSQWLNWAGNYLISRGGDISQDRLAGLALIICMLLAMICYVGLARFNWPGLALGVLLAVGAAHALFVSGGLLWTGMAGVAVIVAHARDQKRAYHGLDWIRYPAQARFMLEALPLASLALALALLSSAIWPAAVWQSPALALRMDMLRSDLGIFDKGFIPSSGEIYEFSIGSSGYYPLGDRLGGPVILSDEPVMTVTGYEDGLLLRGSIASVYTGQRWLAGDDVNLYNFYEGSYYGLRQQVFDIIRPAVPTVDLKLEYLFMENHYYTVQPANQSLTTVFLAGRPENFEIDGIAPGGLYFNNEGLLFVQPALNSRQVMRVDTRTVRTDHPSFIGLLPELAANANDEENTYYQSILEEYLQLPELEPYQAGGSLTALVSQIVNPDLTAWEQANQIRDYLIENCRYSLRVPPPPAARDFVDYFLESREGYCVYFATAETMLCRLAGIPARYIEGYAVSPGNTAEEPRVVTGRQAHAWTEVFLAGLGWVPIDATAGAAPVDDEITPTPTLPVGKPTPDGEDPATPTPSGGTASPTPAISVTPGTRPFDDALEDLTDWIVQLSPWWLLLLLLLPITYLPWATRRYKRRYTADWLEKHYPDQRNRVRFCWEDLLTLLRQLGTRRQPWETPRQYIRRVQEQTTWLAGRRPDVEKMLSGVEKAIYSENLPDPAEIEAVTRLRIIMEKTLRQNSSRLLFVLRRICYHKQKQRIG